MRPSLPRVREVAAQAMLLGILLFFPRAVDAEPSSGDAHEGVWRASSAIMAGTPLDEAVARSIVVKVEGNRYETMVGTAQDRGDCIVEVTTTPKRMTITGTAGPNKGVTFLAIYEMPDKDTLRICYNLTGKSFPETFDTTAENGYYTATYERENPRSEGPAGK